MSPTSLALTAALMILLLWLGGAATPGLWLAIVGLAIALVLARSSTTRSRADAAGRRFYLGSILVASLYLVPLPLVVVRVLAPTNAAIRLEVGALLGQTVRWLPVSLDTPQTLRAVMALALSWCGFELATRLRSSTTVAVLTTATAAVAAVGLCSAALRPHRLYGQFGGLSDTPVVWPLVNPNHAGALFVVAAGLCLAVTLQRPNPRWTGGAAVFTGLAFLTVSKGAIAVLVVQTVVLLASRRPSVRTVLPLAAILGAICVASMIAWPFLTREVTQSNLEKLSLARSTYAMARGYLWLGAGPGAFASTYGPFQSTPTEVEFVHAEHWPGLLAAEWGALGVVPLALGAQVLLSARQPWRRIGILVALGGLLVHDLFDFALELPAMAVVVGLLLGALGDPEYGGLEARPSSYGSTWLVVPWLTATIALGASSRSDLETDRASAAEPASLDLRMARHPADWQLAVWECRLHSDLRRRGAWCLYAVSRAPLRGQTHFALASWLASRGLVGQAKSEVRRAVALAPAILPAGVALFVAMKAGPADVASLVRTDEEATRVRVALVASDQGLLADGVDDWLVDQHTTWLAATTRAAQRAFASGRRDRAHRLVQQLKLAWPTAPETYVLVALVEDDPVRAEDTLQQGLETHPNSILLLDALARRRGVRLGVAAVEPLIERLSHSLAQQGADIAQASAVRASILRARGDLGGAVHALLEAASRSASPRMYLEQAHRIAIESGDRALQLLVEERLARP